MEAERVSRKKSRYGAWIKALSIFMCVAIVGGVGAVVWIYRVYKSISEDPLSVFQKGEAPVTTVIGTDDNVYTKQSGIVNILLLGIDSSEEREEEEMGYRSDVMILCSVNLSDGTMVMVSIPRDTYVPMNKLDYETGKVKSRTTNRINAAYQFGGGPDYYGAKNAVDCVKEFLSCDGKFAIDIDYYVSIDLDGLPKLADSVGGVQVVLDRTLPTVGNEGETVIITSANADIYLRLRKDGGGGDEGRNTRQQDFIIAFIKKVQSMGALKVATSLYSELIKYMKTDLSLEEIMGLASFAQGFSLDNITRYRVVTTGGTLSNGASVQYVKEKELYNFVLQYFYHADEDKSAE